MITAIFKCDSPGCEAESEPTQTDTIDTYTYHDAPSDAVVVNEPSGWWFDSLYHFVACPTHRPEAMQNRKAFGKMVNG